MNDQIKIHHIALQCDNKEKALLFYKKTLCLKETKTFFLSESLTYNIFNLNLSVEVIVFQNDSLYIEVFIVPGKIKKTCAHTCILVDNLVEFIDLCKKNHVDYYSVKKEDRNLWFVKDFSGNIFELKEVSK
jgi:catechol 2,3-dioxygenase-like lactoylglutathione lyase family enzyme